MKISRTTTEKTYFTLRIVMYTFTLLESKYMSYSSILMEGFDVNEVS